MTRLMFFRVEYSCLETLSVNVKSGKIRRGDWNVRVNMTSLS